MALGSIVMWEADMSKNSVIESIPLAHKVSIDLPSIALIVATFQRADNLLKLRCLRRLLPLAPGLCFSFGGDA